MTAADKTAAAFDLHYLAYQYDEEGRELWQMVWRTERVYMVRFAPDWMDPVDTFQVRRMSDDRSISNAEESKEEACKGAYRWLMESTYRNGAPRAYKRIGE